MTSKKKLVVAMWLAFAAGLPAQSLQDARALLDGGNLREARSAFELLLASDATNRDAQLGELDVCERMALEHRAHGMNNEALEDLFRAKTMVPNLPRLYYDMGVLEDEMELFHDADQALAEAEARGMKEPELYYAQARVKMDLGQLAPAEEKMLAYLKQRPNDAGAHYGLGRVYQIGLQIEKARAEFERSIALQPHQTEAFFELGDLALKQSDYATALGFYQKTLALDPNHGGALEGSGEVYYKLKQYQQAYDVLKHAVAVSPEYPPCHYYLGLTLNRLGRREEGQQELTRAARMTEEANARGAMRLQNQNAVQ